MKRTISVVLALLLAFGAVLPVCALDYTDPSTEIPVILIGGDGEPLYDKDGNKVFEATNLTAVFDNVEGGNAYEAVANVLQPFLLEGVLFNRWDRYYENLEREIGELTESFRLDENGDAVNGTTIAASRFGENDWNMHHDKKGEKGYYAFQDYCFWYDWRLDPLEIADRLDRYINNVLAATGAEKVAVASRCVGTTVALAYVAKYGTEKLYGLGLDGSATMGGEFISDAISGKFKVDGEAINRFLTDGAAFGMFNISEFARASVDLLVKSGALDAFTAVARATVYKRIVEGATSALALSTLFTMPCYWGFVTAEDYEEALRYVFGEPGSEKRQQYAGLIEKLDRYHDTVRLHLEELVTGLPENGVRTCIVSKYGTQIVPICASCDAVSDEYASVTRSSFGATACGVFETLSDEYVAAREAEGLERYISPDRQVDASTCMLPDLTWFIKGARHGDWLDRENQLVYDVITSEDPLTVEDLPCTQFIAYDNETKAFEPMTAENCRTEFWTEDQKPRRMQNCFERIAAFARSFRTWVRLLAELLREKLRG